MSASLPPRWLSADLVVLDDRCPLPLDRPFTMAQAHDLGVSRWYARILVSRGLIREVVRGVYVASQVTESLEMRAAALRLVVPSSAVVTDRTAAWLHGVDCLPRSAVHQAPPVEIFDRSGSRVRRDGVASGRRTLLDHDLTVLDGVRVTTPLRTALDLGRRLWRYDAIGALDAFVRSGVPLEQILVSVDRFRGERGVVQLRSLAPLVDARAESPPESALRLYWIDEGLPRPEPQWWILDDYGHEVFRLDLALPAARFAAEYNGRAFHTGEDAETSDEARAAWLLEQRGWTVLTFWDSDVYGIGADPGRRLRDGLTRARQDLGRWKPQGRFLPDQPA